MSAVPIDRDLVTRKMLLVTSDVEALKPIAAAGLDSRLVFERWSRL